MKKMISLCLAAVLLLGIIPAGGAAAPEKDGYTLVPTLYGKTGVDPASAFVLTVPEETTLEEIGAMLSLDGQPAPAITPSDDGSFLLVPAAPLAANSLYLFRLRREGREDLTWAFQTAKKFGITASFPANQATRVPVDSGIEMTFSSEGFSPLESYFSISPAVEGRFEVHKDTAVFIPEKLDYATVYTVTVRAGVKLEGTEEQLDKDFVFAFETEGEPGRPDSERRTMAFYDSYIELPSTEPPKVGFKVYYEGQGVSPTPLISVYKFDSDETGTDAVRQITGTPNWRYYWQDRTVLDTDGLNKIMAFDAVEGQNNEQAELMLPDRLPQGFYVIEATLGVLREQMVIQISDLPVQVVADADKAVLWVNDSATGRAAAGADVLDKKTGQHYQTNAQGVAVIARTLETDQSEQLEITAADGKRCVWVYMPRRNGFYSYYTAYAPGADAYWSVLQLDRALYRRDDTVSFWGFVQNRNDAQAVERVTAVLGQGYYGLYGGGHTILHKQEVSLQNGCFTAGVKLPNLENGSYFLTISLGDTVLKSVYFDVAEYSKPPYQLTVSADKKAIFADDSVTFTAKASFFEGTPVSDLDVHCRVWGAGSLTNDRTVDTKTDSDGKIVLTEQAAPSENASGQTQLTFYAEAVLPEIGNTMQSNDVRVFLNDITLDAKAKQNGEKVSLTANVNTITLDRINDGTAKDYNDYLDAPVPGKNINAEVVRVYYVKEQDGQYYDYVEKRTVPTYTYHKQQEVINQFELVTDDAGKAEKDFTVPNREGENYHVILSCTDSNGRTVSQPVFFGIDYSDYYDSYALKVHQLNGAAESYDIGDNVSLALKRGTEPVRNTNVLFLRTQNGIVDYQAGSNTYQFSFTQDCVPNVYVTAFYFNGRTYEWNYSMTQPVLYNYQNKGLVLTAAADKESYQPGDVCNLLLTAKDSDGNPKEAALNLSVVDEALFALQYYPTEAYTLDSLYRRLGAGLTFVSGTHVAYGKFGYGGGAGSNESTDLGGGAGFGPDGAVREIFQDTAFFGSVRTNEQGEATCSFRLPDNITSWRLTLSGISDDLYAGSMKQNIRVTNPMFLNYALNDTFLLGDTPQVGLNIYGSSLSGTESVEFAVWDEAAPDQKYTASGMAFERVNVPLWEMREEGPHTLVIQATASNGMRDTLKHTYQVCKSYRQVDTAVYYDVTPDTVFDLGGGTATVTFTDRGRGQYLSDLVGLRHPSGDRIEKLVAQQEARRLLDTYFADLDFGGSSDFDPLQYQRQDGGIAILPYAESSLETTAKVLPYILEDIDQNALKNYLYSQLADEGAANKPCALYGLALLQEPVLTDLNNHAAREGLPTKDAVYIALGLCAFGETEAAASLYNSRIAPYLQSMEPYWRVNTGADQDDILAATSFAALLAAKLGAPERDGLYRYCVRNYTQDELINLENVTYIAEEIGKKPESSGRVTYSLFGQTYTADLKNRDSYTLRLPAQNAGVFQVLEVEGDVGAVSVFKKPLDAGVASDPEVTVRRRYYKANTQTSASTFAQGDLVRVQLWVDYSAKALDGSYAVTDTLPAGLAYVNNSAKIEETDGFGFGCRRYARTEGQTVTFYDYNGRFDKGVLYYYYARVISPGEFTAEGTLVQNMTAKGSISYGQNDTITIE